LVKLTCFSSVSAWEANRASERFGRLPWERLLAPAVSLAGRGLPVAWHGTLQIALAMDLLRDDTAAAGIYLPDGVPAKPETLRPLPALATTLETLAAEGPGAFYAGPLAEAIAADLQAGGSRIDVDDLAAYAVEEPEPLSGRHRGVEVHTAGAVSGGQRLLEMLGYVERHLTPGAAVGPETWIAYAKGLDAAFATHRKKVGLDHDVARQQGGCTSHIGAVDGEGNMVALTYTLLNRFGSGVVLPRTGILMNNAVGYFDPRPGNPVSIEGGKRINSSNMCPTIATRDGEALFALGASGANHIVPCTAQLTALLLDYGMSLEEAFHTPRIDASARGSVRADPAMGEAALAELTRITRLVLLWWISRLPSRVGRMWRTMPAWTSPDGMAQLWNVSVAGSKRTRASGRWPDSLYQTMPSITAMA
jgi:gamma-glutamyltranspeptidase / glutathione hydrolase